MDADLHGTIDKAIKVKHLIELKLLIMTDSVRKSMSSSSLESSDILSMKVDTCPREAISLPTTGNCVISKLRRTIA